MVLSVLINQDKYFAFSSDTKQNTIAQYWDMLAGNSSFISVLKFY